MTEIIGDVVQPIALVLPTKGGAYVGKKGELFLVAGKVYINVDGTNLELITSA